MKKIITILLTAVLALAAALIGSQPASAALVPGTFRPSASNTGIPVGTVLGSLGVPSKPFVITVDGTVIDGMNIYGDVKVQAKNVTIKNSYLHGGNYIPSGNSGVVDANSNLVYGLRLLNNYIHPDVPSYYRDGVVGHEYYAARNHVWGTNDGFGVFNKAGLSSLANVTIEGNYVHDTIYFRNDPAHSDGTHNDGVQVQGGENIRIYANTIVDSGITGPFGGDPNKPGAPAPHGHGCSVILQNNTGTALKNVVVDSNWIDDGLASTCIKPGEVTVSNNRYMRNQWHWNNQPSGQQYVIRIDSRSKTIVHGLNTNVWDDTGAVLTEGRNSGIWYNS
ncbi:MAG TPA: hypothetical protein DCR15_05690 [Arthrobacter bacterium]|nr:hypothetical protein [Arthrobacter sp.]